MSDEPKEEKAGTGATGEEPKPPVVFISYSHDTPAHKKWVAELASKLVEKGVEVILDQWDLGLGDDVPKFMEKSVGRAERVLMVCTEKYVRKADDGEGGVGYETMVVSGELVRKLETNKFIPVIRQRSSEALIPKSVSTRLYVNLSEGRPFDEEFEKLLREIHSIPKLRKPPLGRNPFEAEKGSEPPQTVVAEPATLEDAKEMYRSGLAFAQRNDLMGWRKLVQKTRAVLAPNLNAWRTRCETRPLSTPDPRNFVTEAATIYSPLIALAVSGAVSGNPKFNNQAGILDELISPPGWNKSGMTYLTQVPAALVFTFQAVHGAACLFTGELRRAVEISRARVPDSYSAEVDPLFKQPPLVGWPESLSQQPSLAWSYLVHLYENWAWLMELFGSKEDYEASLRAYYLGLHLQELADLVASGQQGILKPENHLPLVPAIALRGGGNQEARAYRMLIHTPDDVRFVWRSFGVTDSDMAGAWEKWLELTACQFRDPFPRWRQKLPHHSLFEDVRPQGQ